MKFVNYAYCSIGIGLIFLQSALASSTASSTSTSSSMTSAASSSTSSSVSSASSTSTSTSTTASSTLPLPSVVSALPTQAYQINDERPKMVNSINMQRSGLQQPLLCQDSMLTSIAQQHANDMAALDDLDHDLSCNSDAYPVQFCKSSKRLQPFGRAAENIISLAGNDGSASAAMAQYNSKSGMFSTMMNPDFLYVGIGMAMNPVSGKYYWVQVFSSGNFQGVSCTINPTVTVLNAMNQTITTVQPTSGLDLTTYPQGITQNANSKQNLYCTLVPFAYSGTGMSMGGLPYPTITLVPSNVSANIASQASGIIVAFNSALSQAGASIIGPSSIPLIAMQVQPTTTDNTDISSITSTNSLNMSTLSSLSISPTQYLASMISGFTPTNSDQSAMMAAFTSMAANPSMSSAFAQIAQLIQLANSNSTSVTATATSS